MVLDERGHEKIGFTGRKLVQRFSAGRVLDIDYEFKPVIST